MIDFFPLCPFVDDFVILPDKPGQVVVKDMNHKVLTPVPVNRERTQRKMKHEQNDRMKHEFLTSDDILGFLRQNIQFIRERFYCSQIGLFGSFARNEQTDESDIDILVRFADDVPDFYTVETELREYLLKQFGRDVDICAEKWIKPIFRPFVSKEVIYA
jgi:hypothetical protein